MALIAPRPALFLSLLLPLSVAMPVASQAQTSGTVVEYVDRGDFPAAPGGLYFYSSDPAEQITVDTGGAGAFFRTGRTFAAGGSNAVCRFYGSVMPGPNSHFFTVDPGECNGLKAAQIVPLPATTPQWNFEGNGFSTTLVTPAQGATARSCPAGTTMVLRTYNNAFSPSGVRNPWDSNHRFVRSQADITAMIALGWKDEGGVFCAPNSSTANVFQKSSVLKNRCVAPRADAKYGDRPGTFTAEKAWTQAYVFESYLWYNELPDITPAAYSTPRNFFDVYKTPAKTASGSRQKDRFHFWYDTPEYEALDQGEVFGYGFEVAAESTTPPRKFVVAYAEANSPAGQNGITRGARILEVDGADLVNGNDTVKLNAGLFPSAIGETHSFKILDLNATTPRTVSLVSGSITFNPVPIASTITTGSGKVGYIVFNDHNLPSEGGLINAVRSLRNAGINDLVLDLRYNGGGYLYIASELAYMIAGPTATNNKIMEKLTFSDKRSAETNSPDSTFPFFDASSGFPGTNSVADAPLPFLNLKRVFVLTSGGTASASEAVINSLEGIDVRVIRIGSTTFGKPYGFVPVDNCNVTYFSVEFKGANNKGYGDYDDGFSPTCVVGDDFNHALGDSAEARLAAALNYRATGVCAAGTSADSPLKSLINEPTLFRTPMRENRLLAPWTRPSSGLR